MSENKMMYPILAYGHPLLRKVSEDIDNDYPDLKELIGNMFETMKASAGVGLAAPQIGKNIRLFMIDASSYSKDHPELEGFKKVFINAIIEEEKGDEWAFEEGCLSVPEIHEEVIRKSEVRITYLDEKFEKHTEEYDGIIARIIQHEYDHLEGVLFVDKISNLKKMLLKRKLSDIIKGNISVNYRMKFANRKRH